MSKKLSKIFKELPEANLPQGLEGRIFRRIELERNKQMRKKLAWNYFSLGASAAAGFSAVLFFGKNLAQSEFWALISLIFSDGMLLAGYWQEFGLSLLETFPVIPIAVILVPIIILLLSLDSYSSLNGKNKSKFA